jgi:hypothetical protein
MVSVRTGYDLSIWKITQPRKVIRMKVAYNHCLDLRSRDPEATGQDRHRGLFGRRTKRGNPPVEAIRKAIRRGEQTTVSIPCIKENVSFSWMLK